MRCIGARPFFRPKGHRSNVRSNAPGPGTMMETLAEGLGQLGPSARVSIIVLLSTRAFQRRCSCPSSIRTPRSLAGAVLDQHIKRARLICRFTTATSGKRARAWQSSTPRASRPPNGAARRARTRTRISRDGSVTWCVDTLRLVVAAVVHTAAIQDRDGAKRILGKLVGRSRSRQEITWPNTTLNIFHVEQPPSAVSRQDSRGRPSPIENDLFKLFPDGSSSRRIMNAVARGLRFSVKRPLGRLIRCPGPPGPT